MEKKQEIETELFIKKLSDDSIKVEWDKEKVWASVSEQVFEKKKKPAVWIWYCSAAAAVVLVFLLFLIPEQKTTISMSSDLPVLQEINEEEATLETIPKSQHDEHLNNSADTHLALTLDEHVKQSDSDSKSLFKVANTNKLPSSTANNPDIRTSRATISSDKLQDTKMATMTLADGKSKTESKEQELDKIITESISKKNIFDVVDMNNSLEGKKIVLTIPTDVQIQEEKPGLFKKLGEYNRTGEWPKDEKAKNLWTRIKESTSSDKSTKL